jgi:DNA repair photolyase
MNEQTNSGQSEILRLIRTTPGKTKDGKPFDFHEKRMVEEGKWRLELVPAEVLGLSRPLEIYRAARAGKFITPWDREDTIGYCLQYWADAKIGKGPCGLRCVACFLIMTHRTMCNPSRHVLYENTQSCVKEVERWLQNPDRQCLGLGIDSSDSLLYEGITGYARALIPMFASPISNPHDTRLILLTKTKNIQYLEGLPTKNVLVTFSLNPEAIADLWEGKFDDGLRVTPPISDRLKACLRAMEMGFETRWRVDPILTPDGWEDHYKEFFVQAAKDGLRPTRITLGTYRETSRSLSLMARNWGLPAMKWTPPKLAKEGMHYHVAIEERTNIYQKIVELIRTAWSGMGHMPEIALCKSVYILNIYRCFKKQVSKLMF